MNNKKYVVYLIDANQSVPGRILKTLLQILRSPVDLLHTKLLPGIARRTTIIAAMQTEDNLMHVRLGRNLFTFFRNDLVCESDQEHPVSPDITIAKNVTRVFAEKVNGIPQAMVNESLLNIPGTAHFMGGVPFGKTAKDGVIGLNCEVPNYPGLFVIDGSIMPANPGINPTLTIAALAEYAADKLPPREGENIRVPLMKRS